MIAAAGVKSAPEHPLATHFLPPTYVKTERHKINDWRPHTSQWRI